MPKQTVNKKPATTKKPVAKPKATTKKSTPKPKKPTIKWKEMPLEELHPFEGFPYRLEYQDGDDRRTCHFECEAHRTKHIVRYKLNKNQIRIDDRDS